MYWRIEAPGMKVDIVELKSSSSGDSILQFSSQDEITRFLETFSIHWNNFDLMLEAIRSTGEAANMSSHQEVAAQLARLVFTDRLRLRKSLSAEDKAFLGPFGMKLGVWIEQNPIQVPQRPASTIDVEKTWIRIQLVGEDRKPIANEKYKITLTDGRTVDGTTDADGAFEFSNLNDGICDVVFPDIDENAIIPI